MSFFDEPEETRTPPRTAQRRRRSSGGGRRPPATTQQTILVRRLVLAAVLIIVIVLIAVLVNSCEVSARNSALRDYNTNVASLNAQSANTGQRFFGLLVGPVNDPTTLQNNLNQALTDADNQLSHAKGLSVPDEVKDAQQHFVLALQMRADAIRNIASEVGPALQSQTSQDALNSIAAEMARFYSSDVLYKDYTVPLIIGALRAAGIAVGGLGGQQVNGSQFLPSIQWLSPSYIAQQLQVKLPVAQQQKKAAPGVHGHAMQSCSVGGTTLSETASNAIPSTPPPTFTCVFLNDGQNVETNVTVKVTVEGTSTSAQTVVPQTTPGQQSTATITFSSAPPKGNYTVKAMVEPVPGEKTFTHNAKTFPITFQ